MPTDQSMPQKRKFCLGVYEKALTLAVDLGVRNIQLAGYDVYYEPSDRHIRQSFIEGIHWAVEQAAKAQVMLSVEIMDTTFINSISIDAFKTLASLDYLGPYLLEIWSRGQEDDISRVRQAKTWIEQQMRLGGLIC